MAEVGGRKRADKTINDTVEGTERSELLLQELEPVMSLVEPGQEEIKRLCHQQRVQRPTELHVQLEKATTENTRLQQLTTELNNSNYNCNDLFKKLKQSNARIQELVASKRNSEAELIAKLKEEINTYEELNLITNQRLQEADKEKQTLKNMNAQLKSEASKNIKEQEDEIARLSQTIKGIKEERKKLEEDLNDTKTGLRKLMGDKLADNNPDEADLSDNNRPTKTAEKYQELYDNQWTDAFKVADQFFADRNEKYRIEILKTMLLNIHKSCEKEFVDQDRELMQALYRKDKVKIDIPDAVKKAVKEMKRQTSTDVIDKITKKFVERSNTATKLGTFIETVNHFVHESVTVCWYMLLQDPPLAFDLEEVKDFDSSRYKEYTATGTRIDFVVWPPLLLHKDGPIVTKGIAQCVKSFQCSKSVRSRSRKVSATEVGVPTRSLRIPRKETSTKTMELLLGLQRNENITKPVTNSTEETITSQMSELNLKGGGNVSKANQEKLPMSKETDNQTDLTPEHHQSGETYSHTSKCTHDNSEVRKENTAPVLQNPIYDQPNQPSHMHQSVRQMSFPSDQSAASQQHQSKLESSSTNQYTQQNRPLNNYRQQSYQNPISQQTQNTSDQKIYQQQSADHSQRNIVQANQQTEQLTVGQYPPELTPTEYEWQSYVYYLNNYGTSVCRSKMGDAVYDKCQKYILWWGSTQNV